MKTWTASDVVYDADSHTSTLPDGRSVPHVTAVLRAVGVSVDFAELASISSYVGENVATARLRGSAVHADCHAYDDGDLMIETVHPAVLPYVNAWAQFRADCGIEPIAHARERRLFHPGFFYTGIVDGVFARRARRRNARVLIDVKTGDPDDSACHIQTAAYRSAWEYEHPELMIDERWAVQLTPNARVPYQITNYTALDTGHLDLGKWLACLCVFNEQSIRRKKIARA